ncbi:MAG: hypothetical protein ACREQL_14810 [Candidatus Binatia bacterium]
MSARTWAAIAILYVLAVVVLTWPVFRHPGTTVLDTKSLYGEASVLVQRDINLDMWTLAWDTHALLSRPLRLFHANAFHPAPYSLAFAEHKLGNLPLFAPLYLLTGNPVLAHQAVVVANFVLAGLAMAAFVLYWTSDVPAAIAAGFFYAFAPFRFWQLGSLDYISIHLLPLVLLGIDATLDRRGGVAAPIGLAVALLVSGLCSYYIAYAGFVLVGVYLAVGIATRGRTALGRLPILGCAVGTTALVIAALSLPYLWLRRSGALADYSERGYESLAFLGLLKYGPHGLLSWYVLPRRDGIPEFLTYTALMLAVLALVRRPAAPRGALVAVAITGIVLGLGPVLLAFGTQILLPYGWLTAVVPGFSSLRNPQRFGALVTLAVAALAGLGVAAARRALHGRSRPGLAALLPAVAVGLFLLEGTPRGLRSLSLPVGPGVPPAYRWLAAHGDAGALLELPARSLDLYRESLFMYYSTYHWLPLVNGYSSYPPQGWREIMSTAMRLPEPDALSALIAAARPRWILFHRRDLPPLYRQSYQAVLEANLRLVERFDEDLLFEVPPPARSTDR